MYFDLLDACDQFVRTRLRKQIGPDGDLNAAYREWYWKHMEEHDRTIFHMMEELDRRSRGASSEALPNEPPPTA